MGTFTHRTTYLPRLLDSVKRFYPEIPFIVQLDNKPIVENFEALRQKFKATGKRFWLFLDDDIEFLDKDTIPNALSLLLAGHHAMVTCYSTFDPLYAFDVPLEAKDIGWAIGYFQFVDSRRIGHIEGDRNLPFPNSSVDTTYSVECRANGYTIGIADGIVYHAYKQYTWTHDDPNIINAYHFQRWGQFYFDCTSSVGYRNIVGAIPNKTIDISSYDAIVDDAELIRNRDKLINWQQGHYFEPHDEVRLNVGSGRTNWNNYITVDIDENADIQADMRSLPFADEIADEISSHHALEHIPYRDFSKTLKEWFRVLKPGGRLDLGMPDVELVCKKFLSSGEDEKWRWFIYCMYGQQATTTKHPWHLTEDDPVDEAQIHRGGLSKTQLRQVLENIGFQIQDIYNYDGMDTPSVYAYAVKPS
jgi:SAM-dependent methyltransferase